MNKKSEIKSAIANVKSQSNAKAQSTIESSKLLAEQLKSATTSTAKRDTQKVTLSVRDADAHKVAHSLYQHRSYMRRATDDETIARHFTQYLNQKTNKYELLTVQLAKQLDLQQMIDSYNATKKTIFRTSDFITASKSCGSAYGDMHRNAMKQLAQAKVITIREICEDNVRSKYEYELNVECDAIKSATAK